MIYLGVREQKRLNTTNLKNIKEHDVSGPAFRPLCPSVYSLMDKEYKTAVIP
jgi:hypothetical protein